MDIDVKRFDDVTRALTGLPDYTVTEALTSSEEGLVVTVQLAASEAPCPVCGGAGLRRPNAFQTAPTIAVARFYSVLIF